MSEMKLIMENWRRFEKESSSTLILREVKQHLEIHSVIQEGFFDDLAEKIPGGKKALSLALAGMIAANALAPGVAAAAETYVDDSGVNVEQAMEVSSEFSEEDADAALGYLHKYQQERKQSGGRDALRANADLAEKLAPIFKYFGDLKKGNSAESPDEAMTDFIKNKVSNWKQSDTALYKAFVEVGKNVSVR
tara:strand:+ start:1746 stop:2321 length:576 start_codon:yes stop_codon:yes gene_type:complete